MNSIVCLLLHGCAVCSSALSTVQLPPDSGKQIHVPVNPCLIIDFFKINPDPAESGKALPL